MRFSEKIYHFLLRAYPRDYRRRYAEPMEQLFRDRLGEVRTFTDLVEIWERTLADWVVSVPARHWDKITRHTSSLADPARRCLFFARSEASSFSQRKITVEHLLLGVLREKPALVSAVSLDTIVRTIEANEPAGRRVAPMEDLPLSEEAIRAVAIATEIAHSAGRGVATLSDLTAGILRETNTLAGRLLREHTSERA